MGVWGTAIFSDDTALDVREDYEDFLRDGLSGAEATTVLLSKWSSFLEDPDESPVFWLSLAATQWKCGRMEPAVQSQALQIIQDGTDLDRWEAGTRDFKKRQLVLQKLRAQLLSPQPPEKHFRKRFRDTNEWETGDLIAYRLLSAKFVILRVIGHHVDKGGKFPICEVLDWTGNEIPDQHFLGKLQIRKSKAEWKRWQFMLGRTVAKHRPDNRLTILGINSKPAQTPQVFAIVQWKWLDETLKNDFGFE